MQGVDPGEVDVAPVQTNKAPRLEGDPVEDVHVVELAVRDVDEARDAAAQVEQGVQLDRALGLAELRPREQREAEVDGCRVQRVNRVRQFHAKAVLGVELAGNLDQAEREVLIDSPVAPFVGIRQRAAGDPATDAQMVQLGRLRPQASFDVPQTLAISQLGKGHAQELVEVGER